MTKVLGLDQSSHCGWAVVWPEMRSPLYGVWHLPLNREDETPAFVTLFDRVDAVIRDHEISDVFFERPFEPKWGKGNRRSSDLQKQYVAIIMTAAGKHGISAEQVPCEYWRERFTGHRRAAPGLTEEDARKGWWKQQALKSCAKLGWAVSDHNAAEAIGIAHFGMCCRDRAYDARTAPIFWRAQYSADMGNAA
ncbi:MAG: hypothetical protein AB7I42_26545 [Bradyrhizobium sp.]|uniref:hypothetical protein n=1 Tax=Bradyrhizobium sp. TaxID=376 RepID=UPI003D0D97D3